MRYSIDKILSDVRIILNNNSNDESLLEVGDEGSIEINELIKSKIVDSARDVFATASLLLMDGGYPMREAEGNNGCLSVKWFGEKGKSGGYVILPSDFMRLVQWEMSDWEKPVSVPISQSDPQYAQQKSKFIGVRGNPTNPVVALVPHPAGIALEFYSCSGGDGVYVSSARYMPIPQVDEEDMIEIPEKCYTAVLYTIAAQTAISLNDPSATVLTEMANSYKRK